MFLAFIRFDLWFQTEANRAKREIQFHRADSDDTIWFVALAKEQLALVTEYGLHGISFRLGGRITVSTAGLITVGFLRCCRRCMRWPCTAKKSST
jgi:hypothetical protein